MESTRCAGISGTGPARILMATNLQTPTNGLYLYQLLGPSLNSLHAFALLLLLLVDVFSVKLYKLLGYNPS